ncbi:MAG: hypothetical protein R3A46_20635 [Thermomicrobiales bacterium]
MSDQVEEIRCRLCGTYFPETDRFCPNCREPRPDVHEDLLMASRLTGVSYETLLQRAWAEDGLVRSRRPASQDRSEPAPPEPEREPTFFDRILERRDSATIGCLVLLGIFLLVAVGAIGILAVRDNFGGDDSANEANQPASPTVTPTPTPTPTSVTGGGVTGGTPADGGEGAGSRADATMTATPPSFVLILNPALPAQFSDGAEVRLIASNLSVFSADQEASPSPGSRFIAHQVEICAGSEPITSSPDDWRLEMPDGALHQPTRPISLPELEPIELAPNQCDSGWITFEIPISPAPAYIVLANPSHEQIRFSWPG